MTDNDPSPYSDTEKELLGMLARTDIAEVICAQCWKFQTKYGRKPTMISCNVSVYHRLTGEQKENFCVSVRPFLATPSSMEAMPHGNWLMLMDHDGVYKEFL